MSKAILDITKMAGLALKSNPNGHLRPCLVTKNGDPNSFAVVMPIRLD